MLGRIRSTTDEAAPVEILLNAITDQAIVILDPNGFIVNWNKGAIRMHQYLSDEIIGEHFSTLFTEDERLAGEPDRVLRVARETRKHEREGWRLRRDGSRFWGHVATRVIDDDNGRFIGFIKTVRDDTERHMSEEALQRTTTALMQAQKMEAVGQLTGGVAHDFNNLLTIIVNSLDFLSRSVQQSREVRLVEIAQQAASRGAKLTQQLLAFSRRQPLSPKVCDLKEVVTGFENVLRRACGETIDVTLELPDDLKAARIDIPQFEAALLNLTVNARDAMPDGGHLTIAMRNMAIDCGDSGKTQGYGCAFDGCPVNGQWSTEGQLPDGEYSQVKSGCVLTDLKAGNYIFISVMDTGEGMSAHVLERVFDPFFTTKDVGKGTGLGLSQVYGFVTQSGGHVAIDSMEGEGTVVRVYLPATSAKLETGAIAEKPAQDIPQRTGQVLIVEDEAGVRDVAVQLFSNMGFTTLTASDGPSALDILRGDAAIDLLFSDVVMPKRMNGFELAREARKLRPSLKVILASGYPTKDVQDKRSEDSTIVIAKPYLAEDLMEKLKLLG